MMITKKRRDASRQRRLVLQKALSVVLSASMTLQGLTYTPVRAYAANEDDVAIDEMYDGSYVDDLATDDQAANGTADDQAVGDAADDQADNQQTDNQQSSYAINDQVTDQQADDQQPVDEQSADEVVIERTADVASAGTAITSLDIVNETTDTVLATATVDNHLIFKVGYEGLEPWSGYSVTVDLLDHRTPEATEAKAVLMGEPYEVEEDVWEQQPFSWVAPLDTEDTASGIVEIDLEEVDLHWVAGASYPVRVTIADADGNQIVQRVFDGEDDAKLNVPGIGALFTAADGAAEVEATDAAQVTDAVTVTGLPKEAEVTVVGEVVDKDGANVSAGAVDLVADKDGKAEGCIDYPTFDATGLGGTAVSSKLSITVADEDGNDVTVAQFPSAADMAREKEPAPAAVAVRAAAEAEAPKADEPKADDAKVDEPVSAEDESLASVVRSEDGGPEAVVVYGEATEDVEVAREALTLSVTAPEANRIAEKLGNIATDGDINGEHNAPSTSEKVNELCAGVTSDSQRMGDGISIATFKLQWATQDSPVVDPDPDFNQLNITTTSDGRLSVMTEIDYSISAGGTLFPPDTIHIYVPATLIFKRGGQTMAGRLNIPYAEYPSRLNDYNWRQVGDYVVISNAIPMDGSSAGYIQIEWANVVPHEVVDEDVSAP